MDSEMDSEMDQWPLGGGGGGVGMFMNLSLRLRYMKVCIDKFVILVKILSQE